MMEAYTERMNQQCEHEALLAAQREQELLSQKQAVQEKEEPPQNSDFRQLIREVCGIKASAEQKQKLEEIMAMNTMLFSNNLKSQCLDKEKEEVKNIVEQATKHRTRIIESLQNFKIIHKKSSISLNNTSLISSIIVNTPGLPTEEREYSLSMLDEYLSTTLETKSDEVIKSSLKNIVPIPSESEVTSDKESECDVPVNDESSPIFTIFSNPLFDCNDDFTYSDNKSLSNEDVPMENFKIYLNPLFDDEESISTKIDLHYFNAESNLLESLLNQDTFIDSSPKFDYLLEEFSGKLTHISLIPPVIEEADFDLAEEIRLIENLLYDNSSPRPPEELNAKIADTILESLSLSLSLFPIPVEDMDSHMEEIDLFLATIDLMPPGIEYDDYDSEGDIHFLEELLRNDSLPLPENESSNFDHHGDPSFPRSPLKPPDVEVFFDSESDTGVLTTKVVKGISEHYVLMPNILPTLLTLDLVLDFTPSHDSLGSRNKIFDPGIFIEVQSVRPLPREEFSISFIHDPLYLVFDTLLLFSSDNENKVFKPGILSYLHVSHQDKITSDFFENLMMMYKGTSLSWMSRISISIPLDQAQVWGIESGSRLG
nr:hypothetical protein [Tanacetum cinerariifolium]